MNRKKRRDLKYGRHKVSIKIAKEGVGAEALGHDEEGHVVVVTTMGLAMLVAGLRSIALESPEVGPLLETLEGALREGAEARKAQVPVEPDAVELAMPTISSIERVTDE
jgi:hypothetical protein